jgi:hypothetical protein
MNFCEAMDLLKSGKRVTRTVWKGSMYFMQQGEGVTSFQPRYMDYSYDEDIMISTGWYIDGDEKEYNFCDIVPFLNEGAKARMTDWKDAFIFLDKTTGKLVLHMMEGFPFMPGFESFTAKDWIEDDPI